MRLISVRQEAAERFRLIFASESGETALVVVLDPTDPWIGEAVRRWEGPRWTPDRFATDVSRALEGRLVGRVVKVPAERSLRIDLHDGAGLAAELAPHAANLVHLGAGGTVVASLRQFKSSRERLAPGSVWADRGVPPGRFDPFQADAAAIDAALASAGSDGEDTGEALRHRFAGLSPVGIELTVGE